MLMGQLARYAIKYQKTERKGGKKEGKMKILCNVPTKKNIRGVCAFRDDFWRIPFLMNRYKMETQDKLVKITDTQNHNKYKR